MGVGERGWGIGGGGEPAEVGVLPRPRRTHRPAQPVRISKPSGA
jgi:hypothetical protein